MKNLLRLEYVGLLLISVYLFSLLNYDWWVYLLLFFLPDVGMIGYAFNTKVGAWLYNIFHHMGLAAVIYTFGAMAGMTELMVVGTVLLGHASFDRIFGYGLKHSDSFQNTHLGMIGRSTRPAPQQIKEI